MRPRLASAAAHTSGSADAVCLAPRTRHRPVPRPLTTRPPPASTVPTTRLLPRQTTLLRRSAAHVANGSRFFSSGVIKLQEQQSNVVARTLDSSSMDLLQKGDHFCTAK